MEMTPERWDYTTRYLRDVFGAQDVHLAGLMQEAVRAGLPDIAISADVGRLLHILVSLTRGKLALELGTLAGYSGIWIARGLKPGGRLITIEAEPKHADFAQRQFERASVGNRVEIIRGRALEILPDLTGRLGPGFLDFVFIDALKSEYPEYWKHLRPLIAPGGLIVADNVLGSGNWWIDDEDHPDRIAADRFSRLVAADPDFEAVAVPIREGVLIGVRA